MAATREPLLLLPTCIAIPFHTASAHTSKFWGPKLINLLISLPTAFAHRLPQRGAVSTAREPAMPQGGEPSPSSPAACSTPIRHSHPEGRGICLEYIPAQHIPGNQSLQSSQGFRFRMGSALGIGGSNPPSPKPPLWLLGWGYILGHGQGWAGQLCSSKGRDARYFI